MSVTVFGEHADKTVHRVALRSSAGLEAAVIGYGASLQDLKVPMAQSLRRVTLGFDHLDAYAAHAGYFGAVVGRFGNRIADGRVIIDGKAHQLDLNILGRHHLHGGAQGFGKKVWTLVDHSDTHCTFELISPDGEMGYPGRLVARVTYAVSGLSLIIRMQAQSDAPSIINLVAHPYFNLSDSSDIGRHRLQINATRALVVDADLIPTGAFFEVAGTAQDFRAVREIDAVPSWQDHCYVADSAQTSAPAAQLHSPSGDLMMSVIGTRPGLQFYDGAHIAVSSLGHDGQAYRARSGLCLESQFFPDAPNHPAFGQAFYGAGEAFDETVEHHFIVNDRVGA